MSTKLSVTRANLAIFPCADLVWNIAGKAISAD